MRYSETLDPTLPKLDEVIQSTIEISRVVPEFRVRKRKNTIYIKARGTRGQVIGSLLGELFALSKLGDLTLREIFVLASLGQMMAKGQKMVKKVKRSWPTMGNDYV